MHNGVCTKTEDVLYTCYRLRVAVFDVWADTTRFRRDVSVRKRCVYFHPSFCVPPVLHAMWLPRFSVWGGDSSNAWFVRMDGCALRNDKHNQNFTPFSSLSFLDIYEDRGSSHMMDILWWARFALLSAARAYIGWCRPIHRIVYIFDTLFRFVLSSIQHNTHTW